MRAQPIQFPTQPRNAPRDGYTIDLVARSEGVSVDTIRRWVREKRFPAPVKRGGPKGKCVWYAETLDALRTCDAA